VKPSDLQRLLEAHVTTPTRDRPDITVEEVYADGVVVRVSATPVLDTDGGKLAEEVLATLADVTADES
jgi:hypothetical protein